MHTYTYTGCLEAETFQVVAVLLSKNLPAETNQTKEEITPIFFVLTASKRFPTMKLVLCFMCFPTTSLSILSFPRNTHTHTKKILATNYQLVFSLQQEMIINNYTLAHRRHSTRGHYLGDNEAF